MTSYQPKGNDFVHRNEDGHLVYKDQVLDTTDLLENLIEELKKLDLKRQLSLPSFHLDTIDNSYVRYNYGKYKQDNAKAINLLSYWN